MKVLEANRKLFAWLGVFSPSNENLAWRSRIGACALGIICFVFAIIGTVSSIAFILNNVRTNLEDALYALMQVAGFGYAAYTIIVAFILRNDLKILLNQLQDICDTYQKGEFIDFFKGTNDECEYITSLFVDYFVVGNTIGIIAALCISVCYTIIINGDVEVEHLFGTVKYVLPWNQKAFIGWFLEQGICVISSMAYFLVTSAILSLFIAICKFHRSFFKYFQKLMKNIDQTHQTEATMGRLRSKEILCDTIRFHGAAKMLFLESVNVFSPFIFMVIISAIVLISGAIFEIDLVFKHPNLNLITMSIALAAGIVNLLFYCFLGKTATESYSVYTNCVYFSDWLKLPVDQQQILILIIQSAQRTMVYRGFDIFPLNLDTFTKTLKTVGSYYMMFKTLSK